MLNSFGMPVGPGEMSSLIASYDWASTELGAIETWPACLRAAVDIMLPAKAQIVMFWGQEFIALYNDAYAPSIGEKHPQALGRPARENWSELWSDLAPLLMRVRDTGETVFAKDRPFYIERHGYPETVYFDISYSPIRDEIGAVRGVLCIVNETTDRIQSQQELKRSQERLANALSAAGMIGTYDWNIETNTVFSDASSAAVFSLDPELGETGAPLEAYFKAVHPDDAARVKQAICNTIETGGAFAVEYRLIQADGSVRWIDARGRCLFNEAGKPIRFAGAIIDISDRKATESALGERQRQFQAMFAQTATGIAQTDTEGRFKLVNDRYCDIVGYSREELMSLRMQDITHPDDLPENKLLFANLIETGASFEIDKRYIRKNGTQVWVTNSVSVVRNEDGDVEQAVAVVTDITERKRRLELERRLASIIASSDDAIISIDLNMTVISWNEGAERLYGYSAEEIVGRPVTLLVAEGRRSEEVAIIERISSGHRVEPHDTVRRRKDGSEVEVSLTVSPIFDEYGSIVGASKIARDISARKNTERLQSVVMGELNHRVKNLLAIVQSIARQTFGREKSAADVKDIFAARLQSLAQAHDILMRNNWENAELSAIVSAALAPYRGEQVRFEGPLVSLDAKAVIPLALSLHELGTNATKYGALSTATGRVSITWMVTEDPEPMLKLRWVESGGPKVVVPSRSGFGSRMISRVLASELAAAVHVHYNESGVICEIDAPL